MELRTTVLVRKTSKINLLEAFSCTLLSWNTVLKTIASSFVWIPSPIYSSFFNRILYCSVIVTNQGNFFLSWQPIRWGTRTTFPALTWYRGVFPRLGSSNMFSLLWLHFSRASHWWPVAEFSARFFMFLPRDIFSRFNKDVFVVQVHSHVFLKPVPVIRHQLYGFPRLAPLAELHYAATSSRSML